METNRRAVKGLGKVLATGALAAVALAAPFEGKATTISVDTVINNAQDMDLNKEGIQWRYDWAVLNDTPNSDWDNDSIWKYTIQANLEERGMYGFSNSGTEWAYNNGDNSSWDLIGGSYPLRPGNTKTYSAYIDANQVLGNEWVGSYGLSNNGDTQIVDVQVPIPEPTTISLLAGGALAALAGRRIKDNYKKF